MSTGKISMKAVQQQVFNLNKSGDKSMAYVLRPTRYSTIGENQIVEYCAMNSMVPKAYVSGTMHALAQSIINFLLNGHTVVFPNLGSFSLTSTGYAEGDVSQAGLAQLKKLNVRFLPCKDLKALVDQVEVELDGVFDIAGEIILSEATGTTPARTQKYYKRVVRTLTVDADGNPVNPDGGGTGTNTGSGTQGSGTQGSGTDSGNTGSGTLYTLSISSADASQGSVDTSVNKQYSAGSRVTIKATPQSGYAFDKWSDGSSVNPRNITLNQDITLTAIFKTATVTPPGEDDDDSPFDGGM